MLAQNTQKIQKPSPNKTPPSTQPHPLPPATQLQTPTNLSWLHHTCPQTLASQGMIFTQPHPHPHPCPPSPPIPPVQGAFFRKDLQRLTSWSSVKTRPHRPESSAWTRGTYLAFGGGEGRDQALGLEQMGW